MQERADFRCQNVFVTGGSTLTPNFDYRLSQGIQSILPVGTPFRIIRAEDVIADAWRGLSKWATTPAFQSGSITRQEYNEYGAEYFKDHPLTPQWF
jgi:actin-related protein 5